LARIDDYREAFRLACQEFATVNLHRVCSLSGATFVEDANGGAGVRIPFFTEDCLVQIQPKVEILNARTAKPLHLAEKIIVLHYLLTARGDALTNNPITFRQVSGGSFYYSAFLKRARDPLVRAFGREPERLLSCGQQLGAEPERIGDVSIKLRPLPLIPITLALWKGDDELDPEGSILFDESIGSYLPTEDIAVLSGMTVYRLIGISRSLEETQ
jgi:hypothetical protein